MNKKISSLRIDYRKNELNINKVSKNPFEQFRKWFEEVIKAGILEPNAMTLATSSKNSVPSARTVLLKSFTKKGFIFFTNYSSRKARDIDENPHAAILFFWKEFERQVRISGRIEKVSKKISREYFNSRPFESRIAALVSHQSSVIESKKMLEEKFNLLKKKYSDGKVPLPDYWGGYILIPDYFEFWQGRPNRLHDRIAYKKEKGNWRKKILAP
ncbi:MAG: pyridoxamine 5'-phosphate oxidase [Ignavibacteriaceae bacterium]|nr:pyridoxamine 5'-phosphate oxidase [Ignavibacteriaceae bacterium]